MNVLLTGSNGYLGSVLYQYKEKNYNYLNVDLGLFSERYPFDKLDVGNAKFRDLFKNKIDTVIHLAAVSNDPSGELDPKFTLKNNVEASKRLIDFSVASGVQRFIFVSSASVYGANDNLVDENCPVNPQTHYAESKVLVENYLQDVKEISPVIFRFGTLFGVSPKMRFDLAINLMVKDALITGKLNVYGGGDQYRPFLMVRDAANILNLPLLLEGQNYSIPSGVYNVCSANIKIKSLAEIISDITNSEIVLNSYDHPDKRNYRMNITKFLENFPKERHSFASIASGVYELSDWVNKYPQDVDNPDYYTINVWKEYLKHENTLL